MMPAGFDRNIPAGMAYVREPLTMDTAKHILDLTEEAGYDRGVVRTGEDGFYVPADVVAKLYPPEPPKTKVKPTEEGTS